MSGCTVGFEAGDWRSGALRFAVEDTGIGIAVDRQERIFLPFTQVDASTTRTFGEPASACRSAG